MDTWIGIGLGVVIGLLVGFLLAAYLLMRSRAARPQRDGAAQPPASPQAQRDTDLARAQVETLQTELQRAQSELGQARASIAALQTERASLQNEIATVRPMLNRASSEKDKLLIDVISLKAENDTLRAELARQAAPSSLE
jgi:septal ring factor EnvC (AmiA/AmiB activator)